MWQASIDFWDMVQKAVWGCLGPANVPFVQ